MMIKSVALLLFLSRHSKCELAKMLNTETSFREILDKKDAIILDKEEKIMHLERHLKDKNK